MPRRRRTAKRRFAELDQEWELTTGPAHPTPLNVEDRQPPNTEPLAFASEEERRGAWNEHRGAPPP